MSWAEGTVCWSCLVGLFDECANPQPLEGHEGYFIPCGQLYSEQHVIETNGAGRPVTRPDQVTDEKSTGRKRATMLAPILTGSRCEWSGLRSAGGGPVPIVGCEGNLIDDVKRQADVRPPATHVGHLHHGPDKATLNNAVGANLHRVCAVCHNRWHAANDEFYAKRQPAHMPFLPTVPYYLHDPINVATAEEIAAAEDWWATAKAKRGAFPVVPLGPIQEPIDFGIDADLDGDVDSEHHNLFED